MKADGLRLRIMSDVSDHSYLLSLESRQWLDCPSLLRRRDLWYPSNMEEAVSARLVPAPTAWDLDLDDSQ